MSSKFIRNVLSYVAHRQTNKQTDKQINAGKNIYLLAEVNNNDDNDNLNVSVGTHEAKALIISQVSAIERSCGISINSDSSSCVHYLYKFL